MSRRLPPLESLRVFEACARHGTFTRAAGELGVTPTAVSLRVRDLEADLGRELFCRNGPRVALTEAGAALAARLGLALTAIREAVFEARAERVVRVTAAPTFAARWLAPRLGAYPARDGVRVRLRASAEVEGPDSFDVAIRSGSGGWAGLRSLASLSVEGTPMLSPALAAGAALANPADLLRLPLLRDERWPAWFVASGVDGRRAHYAPVEYPTQELAAAAAVDSAGVALLSPVLFGSMVEQGKLVRPFERIVRGSAAYHVLVGEGEPREEVRHFCTWLVGELTNVSKSPA